jgi:uncharacterized membrane protein
VSALRVGLGAWAALVALQFAWYLVWAPPAGGAGWIALLLTVPLLMLPLLALQRSAERALLWVGILALGFFSHGVVAAWTSRGARVPALLECALCVLVVGAIGGHTLQQRRATRGI